MLFSQLLLFCHDDVELVLLGPDIGFNGADLCLQLFSTTDFIVEVGCIPPCFCLIFFRLGEDVVIGDLRLVDLIIDASELVFSLLRLLVFELELGNEFLMVVFCLMKSLIQLSVD
jgi:hypothetical protein